MQIQGGLGRARGGHRGRGGRRGPVVVYTTPYITPESARYVEEDEDTNEAEELQGLGGFGAVTFPAGVSAMVGQAQQLVNGARCAGAYKGQTFIVTGIGSDGLAAAVDSLMPYPVDKLGDALTSLRRRFKPMDAGCKPMDWFQAPDQIVSVTVTDPVTKKKITKKVKRKAPPEPAAMPPTPWYETRTAKIGGGVAALAVVAAVVLRKRRRAA